MHGFITTKDLLRHPALIVRCFGVKVYARAIIRLLARNGEVTFLECI